MPKRFIAFYGIDKVRFTEPIKIGDTIRCEAKVIELKERNEDTGAIKYECSIKNQRDENCIFFYPGLLVGRKKLKIN